MKASPTEEYFCAQVSAQKPGANLGHPAVFGTTQRAARDGSRSSQNGRHENANERREDLVQRSNCPTQAKTGLEWATRPVSPKAGETRLGHPHVEFRAERVGQRPGRLGLAAEILDRWPTDRCHSSAALATTEFSVVCIFRPAPSAYAIACTAVTHVINRSLPCITNGRFLSTRASPYTSSGS